MTLDYIDKFRSFLADNGLLPADNIHIIPDGILHRYRGDGDKPGKCNCAYVLHGDEPVSGFAQSWRLGVSTTWTAKKRQDLTRLERAEIQRRLNDQRQQSEQEQTDRHEVAKTRTNLLWNGYKAADTGHKYLQRKMIAPGNARQCNDSLVVAVQDVQGTIWSLQYIDSMGTKMLLKGGRKKGCFVLVSGSLNMPKIYIAEGFATSSSLAELSPDCCHVAAIDAGNLEHVSLGIRASYPSVSILIAADTDATGMQKAKNAAIACSGKMIIPPLTDAQKAHNLSDWNDWLVGKRTETPV